ncbi:hypothetical protein PRO82_000676 [Candidatus Protochlamydia amoebophila]|uniref:IS630 transposase-related protein n=1 Tax=Candidatus Protochlamydia amoebophila TaxID=362787 RepID=UPI001BC940FB|nr:hypothetical protein [Candidatus Protochlamydia amoebophila]
MKRQRNGCLEDKPRKRHSIKIDHDQLKNYIKKYLDNLSFGFSSYKFRGMTV